MTGPLAARMRSSGDDRGGATVLVLAIGLVTVLVAIASAAVGAAIVARHRAQSAADLAALAGALAAFDGIEVACARAGEIAAGNGGHLTACDLDGLDVVVTVEARPAGLAAMAGYARASARAGPVDAVPVGAAAEVPAVPEARTGPAGAAVGVVCRGAGAGARAARTASRVATAPALSSGSLPLPHLGTARRTGSRTRSRSRRSRSRVALSQSAAAS